MAEDPVAEFLNREKDDLAGLDDDLDIGGTASRPLEPEEYPSEVIQPYQEQNEADFFYGGGDQLGGGGDILVAGDFDGSAPPMDNRVEEAKLAEMREQAKKELKEWYRKYGEQLEKTKQNNKLTEEEFIIERDTVQPGKDWERIVSLCEFSPKLAKNSKDVSRMRGLLLQMKAQQVTKNA